jgi:hypothetical protein
MDICREKWLLSKFYRYKPNYMVMNCMKWLLSEIFGLKIKNMVVSRNKWL